MPMLPRSGPSPPASRSTGDTPSASFPTPVVGCPAANIASDGRAAHSLANRRRFNQELISAGARTALRIPAPLSVAHQQGCRKDLSGFIRAWEKFGRERGAETRRKRSRPPGQGMAPPTRSDTKNTGESPSRTRVLRFFYKTGEVVVIA